MEKVPFFFSWSSGKDSAMALRMALEDESIEVKCLLTTVNEAFGRVSMHGTREELLDRQAECLGLPLRKLRMPEAPSMEDYEKLMADLMEEFGAEGLKGAVFGDIFLDSLKEYREKKMAEVDMDAKFPLWKRDTWELMREFVDLGFKAVVVCVSDKCLDKSFVGRELDQSFVDDLPEGVDPCGENGEFHTFVYDGPIFSKPVKFSRGEVVYRTYKPSDGDDTGDSHGTDTADYDTGFYYMDLSPD
ncbi:hypothetical protein FUAX_03530 [Fulvitalea axinellae]|uniref:Diphthamide synthase domain-containing protein n=1 Tax=Fulvitalea axinellae TaxID=1182444 RepID=A0AAU9CGN5_9BACT|nr:hypothetical protein FUAX_03530 [Fulvitalea axinellae]